MTMFNVKASSKSYLKNVTEFGVRDKFISLSSIECKYGNINYNYLNLDPSYTLNYKNYEIDISYCFDELQRAYKLKCGIYHGDEIIGFDTDIAFSLNQGLINMCEKTIENFILND